jgi:hypothetical protein
MRLLAISAELATLLCSLMHVPVIVMLLLLCRATSAQLQHSADVGDHRDADQRPVLSERLTAFTAE